ncbi:heme o synthase [Rhodococcus sp. TAF43]|uniref:heme o synthase n=1 Tax=unclassified Rhodococcus (in: high G+C Gram-positive bacteria) TaxID=192944 RepID=UPI0015822872|nr:heme o synthase [Rhodococcus sp. W8901]QKT11453.1 protoheme IX farnesyltransferase [Rhodococcus sp. W8901]
MRTGHRPSGHGFGSPAAASESKTARDTTTLWGRVSATILAYIALTKPRVIELLLVATIPAMLLADRGHIDLVLIISTLFGGWMGAASANSLNCVVDADIDKVMKRTALRPLARQAVPTRHAFVFGMTLGVASFLWLWWRANLLAGFLVVLTIAFYVLVYTMVLKRRTWQNVIWGGAAGCMPVMVGWAAVTGSLSWEPVVLFLIIFFWTPPHTWALAMRYKEDYKAAGVPMLPVIASEEHVTKQIVIYTWATVLASLALVPAAGWIYAGVTLLAGAWFLFVAHQLYNSVRGGTPIKPLKLFLQSNNYLAVVCCGLAVDSVLGWNTIASYF